jgi:predicted GNAT family acetyltransferase
VSWRKAGRRDLAALLEFLLPEEALFVPFTSRLRSGARGFEIHMDADPTGAVRDCFLYTSGGLLLPAFSREGGDRDELSSLLNDLTPMVHSIMGPGRCVDVIQSHMPLPPTTRVEYFLMSLERGSRHPVLPPGPPGVHVRTADAYDAEILFPMQKGYEMEEVVISPAHFNDAQSMKSLRLALREQLVYLAEISGVPVSKAGTNARGYKVDQVGGVYTVPEQRGRGLGKAVVSELLKAVFSEKQAACLFVKKHNRPAISVYDRLGFSPTTDYTISYYGL